MSSICGAFVGEKTAAASEYHSNDFDWEDLRAEVEALSADKQHLLNGDGCNGESSGLRLKCNSEDGV